MYCQILSKKINQGMGNFGLVTDSSISESKKDPNNWQYDQKNSKNKMVWIPKLIKIESDCSGSQAPGYVGSSNFNHSPQLPDDVEQQLPVQFSKVLDQDITQDPHFDLWSQMLKELSSEISCEIPCKIPRELPLENSIPIEFYDIPIEHIHEIPIDTQFNNWSESNSEEAAEPNAVMMNFLRQMEEVMEEAMANAEPSPRDYAHWYCDGPMQRVPMQQSVQRILIVEERTIVTRTEFQTMGF